LHCEEGKKKEKKIDVAIISLSILAFSQKCATLSFLLRWQNAKFQKPKINPRTTTAGPHTRVPTWYTPNRYWNP
jgi:hypothetical protein